ncbi:replication stress response regulator SDE2 isoform X2 [Xiphias gladius]|uniref:replication stress response regulator SDE2 isoform X2 n=1 Tax=Xiphias gladius TaxID=8245 RepID=UPI001A9900EE|nr:replication stress response regulator SDE2 isoform X2 [Xiphias gladius]
MEVCVSALRSRCNLVFPDGSVVRDVLTQFIQLQGFSSEDFYVVRNGRLSDLEDPLQHGAVYHLEPRLCGGKGGFGSMLRALGAQIEKTTNREACRDLSGRRLRDVNHEKEMAEWLKKQSEREAEKEQRRLERLQRKLSEPKHQFADPEYQQQCHDLSERLEDSVLKGLQASSSSQVKVDNVSAAKRPNSDQSEQPEKKRKATKTAAACFWTGAGELDELLSSEEDDNDDDEESPSTSSSSCGAVTVTTRIEEAEPEQSSSSSSAHRTISPSEDQKPPETSRDQTIRPSEDQKPPETSRDQTIRPSEDQKSQESSKASEGSSCWSQQQRCPPGHRVSAGLEKSNFGFSFHQKEKRNKRKPLDDLKRVVSCLFLLWTETLVPNVCVSGCVCQETSSSFTLTQVWLRCGLSCGRVRVQSDTVTRSSAQWKSVNVGKNLNE